MKKFIAVLLVAVMCFSLGIGGTIAYLTDRETETNVFTVGNVEIELTNNFKQGVKLLPGKKIEENVTIENVGDNNAYVFYTYAVPTNLVDAITVELDKTGFIEKTDITEKNIPTGYTTVAYLYDDIFEVGDEIYGPKSVTLSAQVDIDPDGNWYLVDKGNVTDLKWNTNTDGAPKMYVAAYAIQAEDFANVEAAYNAYIGQWAELNAEYEEAVLVATADELKAALEAGESVALTADIDMGSEKLTVAKDLTLDLNGHILSGECEGSQGYLFMVNQGATLNIKSSGSEENGKITYTQGTSNTGWAIDVEGKLNLYSGTIELIGDSWDIAYCVDVRPNAWGTNYAEDTVFTMYGGKLVSSFDAVRVASSSSDSYTNIVASFVMEGGEIDAARDGIFVQQSNVAYDTLKVEIKEGAVVKGTRPIRVYGPNPSSVNAGTEKPMTIIAESDSLVLVGTLDTSYDWHTEGKIAYRGGITLDNLKQYSTIVLK